MNHIQDDCQDAQLSLLWSGVPKSPRQCTFLDRKWPLAPIIVHLVILLTDHVVVVFSPLNAAIFGHVMLAETRMHSRPRDSSKMFVIWRRPLCTSHGMYQFTLISLTHTVTFSLPSGDTSSLVPISVRQLRDPG